MDRKIYYLGNEGIRGSGVKLPYTRKQQEEWNKCADDPMYFIENYVHIISLDEGRVKFKAYDFQKEYIKTCVDNRFVIVKWPRQSGKELCVETPILTPNGFTKLKDLNVDDKIYGPDGKETKIKFITPIRLTSKAYEVVFDNGDVLKACEDHLWEVNSNNWRIRNGAGNPRKDGNARVLPTKELIPFLKHSQRLYINFTKPLEMDRKNLLIDPYLFGLWLGDGNSSGGWITCHKNDFEFYKTQLQVEATRFDNRTDGMVLRFKVKDLTAQLRSYNLINNKHIPSEYLLSSLEQRLELLKGLMDTDGSITSKGETCEFYQKNENLIDQVRTLLSSLGIKSRKRSKIVNGRIYWTISFRPLQYVFKLKRKYELQKFEKDHVKNHRLYINEIREVESVTMRCLQVDNESHLFLAGETLIPTHNTTTTAAMMLWYALFHEDYSIALLAHKEAQSREILSRIRMAFEMLPIWLQQGVTSWNKGDIAFENGSKIECHATGSGVIRGRTYNMVYLDEFAHVEKGVQEDFYTATYPTITSGQTTKLIITSTPKGMELFYKFWNESEMGKNNFVRHEAFYWQVPGRDEKWKEETIKNTSQRQFDQEFLCDFLGSTNTLIDSVTLKRLTYKEPIGTIGDLRFFKEPEKGHTYACCVDCSEGLNQDYHVFTIIDVTEIPYKVVAVYRNNDLHHLLLPNYIYNAAKHYNNAVVLIETQSTGAQVAQILLHDLEYEGVLTTTLKGRNGQRIGGGFGGEVRIGVMMNKQVKRIGCTNLKALIEQDRLIFNDERILQEFRTFVASDKQSFEAEPGSNDDMVMTLVLFSWMVSQNYFKEVTDTDIRENLYNKNMEMIEQDLTPFGMIDGGERPVEDDRYNPTTAKW